MSIQPLDDDDDDEEGGGGCGVGDEETPSSKPKSLQIRVGKAKEKKWRDWSGEWEWRKESMEAQAAEIWEEAEEARMVAARSWDLDTESTVYEWGSMVTMVGASA